MMDYKRNIDNIPHISYVRSPLTLESIRIVPGDELWLRLDRIILLQPTGEDKHAVRRPKGACNVLVTYGF